MKYVEKFHKLYKKDTCTGCWNWLQSLGRGGYGRFWDGMKEWKAHRYSYFIHKGIIYENKLVLHKCDNPKCVNPDHLILGTHKDNTLDMYNKGRNPNFKGSKNPSSKLSDKDVLEIRHKYTFMIHTLSSLAKEYKVSFQLISQIVNKKIWSHI